MPAADKEIVEQLKRMNESLSILNENTKNISKEDKGTETQTADMSRLMKAVAERDKKALEAKQAEKSLKDKRKSSFFGDRTGEVESKLKVPELDTKTGPGGLLGAVTSTIGKILDGQSIAPTGAAIMSKFGSLIDSILKAVNPFRIAGKLVNALSTVIEGIFNLKIPFLGKLSETFIGKITGFFTRGINWFLEFIGKDIFTAVLKGFDLLTLPALIWGFVRNYVKEAIGNNKFGLAIFSLVDNMLQPINNFFDHLFNVIKDAFTGNYKDIPTQLKKMIGDTLDFAYGYLINPFKQLYEVLPDSVKKNPIVSEVTSFIASSIDYISKSFSEILNPIEASLKELYDYILIPFTSLKNIVKDVMSGSFTDIGKNIADILSWIAKTSAKMFFGGIKLLGEGLWLALKGLFDVVIKLPFELGFKLGTAIDDYVDKNGGWLPTITTLLQHLGQVIIGVVTQIMKNLIGMLPDFVPGKSGLISKIDKFQNDIADGQQQSSITTATPAGNQSKQTQSATKPKISKQTQSATKPKISNQPSNSKTTNDSTNQPQTIGPAAPTSSSSDTANPAVSVVADGTKRTYTMTDGTQEVREGGTRAWRNNNPGNIRWLGNGDYAKSLGAIGHDNGPDGTMAVFPTIEAGEAAQRALLFQSKKFKNLTLSEAVAKYAPPDDNNPTALYQANALKAVGGEDKKLSEYSPAQQEQIMSAMTKQEGGFQYGKINIISKTGQRIASPSEVKGTVANYGNLPSQATYVQPTTGTADTAPGPEKTFQQVEAENQLAQDTGKESFADQLKQAINKTHALKQVVHRKAYDTSLNSNLTVSGDIKNPSTNVEAKDTDSVSKQQLEATRSIAQQSQAANWDLDTAPYDVDLVKLNLGEI